MELCICSNFFLITSIAGFTGIDVKRAATSYEMMHSPPLQFDLLDVFCKFFGVVNLVDGVPRQGFQNSGQLLGYPIRDRALAGKMGLRGMFFLWILGSQYSLVN